MMKKLGNRGVAAFEFVLVFVPLFSLMFVIFDLGRYAITVQSLETVAGAYARALMLQCYTPQILQGASPCGCTATTYTSGTGVDPRTAAPFASSGGSLPTISVSGPTCVSGATGTLTVTAAQPAFTMLMPIWGGALDSPSASTTIPF